MLDAHLVRCEDCRTYAADVVAFTNRLRAAPLEPLERPVVIQRSRRTVVGRPQLGLAAGVAVVVLGTMLQVGTSVGPSSQHPSKLPSLVEGANEMQLALADRRAFDRHRGGSTGVI